MKNGQPDRFIYIVGEHQDGIIPENPEVFAFTRKSMERVETDELQLVLANVFARGQYFPGPDGALASVIHEFVARSERYRQKSAKLNKGRCTLVTALKRLDGEISVKVTAVMPVEHGSLDPERPEGFHTLLIRTLPDFQNALIEEAYAQDSKLIGIIKEATMHHIQGSLQ
ncbi:hypothetical protein [Desulfobulbus elongatus]|uniref:hypothetical protein n=1 Tax=Desulfobulbus elongatus TaxID=53332 RepID=UPI00047FBBE9|nr:hypothetical protein [Desulfobulbus elongatus]